MANRFWVAGTGNWSDNTNHWSATSGGSPGASLPTSADDVYFDANSFSGAGQEVFVDINSNCLNMDWTGVLNTPNFNSAYLKFISIYGSLTMVSGMTVSGEAGYFIFKSTSTGKTITTAGKTCYSLIFSGAGGGWTLQDNVTVYSNFQHATGTLNTNSKNITVSEGGFLCDGASSRDLTLGASIITVSSGSVTFTATGLAFNPGTSRIILSRGSQTFAGSVLTFYALELQCTTATLSGNSTFSEVKLTAGKSVIFTAGTTQTIARLGAIGSSGNLITMYSTTAGTPFTITRPSGVGSFNVDYCSIKDCTSNVPMNAYNSTNVSGNSANVTFPAGSPINGRFWVGNGGNWSDITHWSTVSGGAGGASVPTLTDDVYFDANSFTATGQSVTIDVNVSCLSMDWTGAGQSPTLVNSYNVMKIYGSFKLISAMSLGGAYGGWFEFKATTTGKTITSAGKSSYSYTFNGVGGGWTLQDDVDLASNFQHTNGTLDTNSKAITCGAFVCNSGTRVLNLGSSVITVNNGNVIFATANLTFNPGTSVIKTTIACGFTGGGATFNRVELQQNATIYSSSTFADLVLFPAKTYTFTAGTTQTVGDLSGDGTAGNLVTILSSSAGSPFTLSKSSGTISVDYYSIKDSTATGGATFTALNSTSVSGNTGWAFPVPVSADSSVSGNATVVAEAQVFTFVLGASNISGSATVLYEAQLITTLLGASNISGTATVVAEVINMLFGASSVSSSATVIAEVINVMLGASGISGTATVLSEAQLITILLCDSSIGATATVLSEAQLITILLCDSSISVTSTVLSEAQLITILLGASSIVGTATIVGNALKNVSSSLAVEDIETFQMNGNLYIQDGTNYLEYDGIGVVEPTPYIPTVTMGRAPGGGGTPFEDFNLLGAGFKDSFSGTVGDTVYTLSLTGLDATPVTAVVNGVAKVETTDFTVNRVTGKVTFLSAPGLGTNNVVITAYKTVAGRADRIKQCRFNALFGGANDTRVFVSGNPDPDFWNVEWYCAIVNGVGDPTYFPENNFIKFGKDSEKIIGYSKQYDYLVVFKEDSTWTQTYETDANGLGIFPIKPLNDTIGCIAKKSIAIINNNPVVLSRKGVFMLQGGQVRDERSFIHLSQRIDPRLMREENLETAIAVDYDTKYFLALNGNVYVFDYRDMTEPDTNEKYVSLGEWYFWDSMRVSCLVADNGRLYFGSTTVGMAYKQKLESEPNAYNDNGLAIVAYWYGKMFNFDSHFYKKNVDKIFITLQPDSRTSADLYYISDSIRSDLIETIAQYLFSYSAFSYLEFNYLTNRFPQTKRSKIKAKKIIYFQPVLKNSKVNESMGIQALEIHYTYVSEVK